MTSDDAPILIVPGFGGPSPEHWQHGLAARRPGARWVEQRNGKRPIRWIWVRALEREVDALSEPAVLVGHSLGVMTIVQWAARSKLTFKIAGALLVAPPDVETRLPGLPPVWLVRWIGWTPIPLRPLPFRSIVVASRTDPMCAPSRARAFAEAWKSRFVDLGDAGHINGAAGYGPWPQSEALIRMLEGMRR